MPDYTKQLVKSILEHPGGFEWSLQGFGMLRTYIEPELRLHVWDSRFKVEDVSEMHTHPWHFHSFVVVGQVTNTRFVKPYANPDGIPFREQEILCGVGGHETDRSKAVKLSVAKIEKIKAGETYSQLAHEIHQSWPEDGTVTIIEREFLDDADHAYVYVPEGQEWVSAEPRPADPGEVESICHHALTTWFRD